MKFEELPDFVRQKIQEISEKKNIPIDELVEEYNTIFNDPFIQTDPQFKDDYDRHRYAIRVLTVRILTRPPTKTVTVIPIGYTEARKTRSGTYFSNIYVVVVEQTGLKIRRMLAREHYAEIYKDIELFNKYTIKVGYYDDGTLVVDSRTKFVDPEPIPMEPKEFLDKLGIPVVTLAEVENYYSRVTSTGYVDDTDWRGIQGIIVRRRVIERDDGTKFGVMTIMDDTVPFEERVLPDGRVVPPGLTVFAPPSQMKYAEDSECLFYGTIEKDNNGLPYMNAYLILPVHVRYV